MGTAFSLRGVAVEREGRLALADVDLTVPTGAMVAVIGPNGSGKSTLLHTVVGLVPPVAGTVDADRTGIALVMQSTDVDRGLPITVRDTVRLARYARRGILGRFRADDHAAVAHAMERLDVAHLARRQLHALSGGQRQRVLVAQGLAQEASTLLLDEPLTGLDLASRELIARVVAGERDAGRTVVMATHHLEDAHAADLVVLLATRPVAVGPPADVLTEANLRVAFGGRVIRVGDHFVMDDPHHGSHGAP